MAGHRPETGHSHQHRGKSSEAFLDKDAVLEGLDIAPGAVVLDAGCGNGYMAKAFAARVGTEGRVYALDPDPVSIDRLQSKAGGLPLEAFVGDITQNTGLPDSTLDLLYLSNVVHGFSAAQLAGLAAEAKRLLKPGGRLAIVEFRKEETPIGPPLDIRLSPAELQAAIPLPPIETAPVGGQSYLQIFRR